MKLKLSLGFMDFSLYNPKCFLIGCQVAKWKVSKVSIKLELWDQKNFKNFNFHPQNWKFFEDLEWKIENFRKLCLENFFHCVGVGGGCAMLKTWKRGHFGIKSNKY